MRCALIALLLLLSTPSLAAWVDNGNTAFEAPQFEVFGGFSNQTSAGQGAFVVTIRDFASGGTSVRRIHVQKMDKCGVRLWGNEGVVANQSNFVVGNRPAIVALDGGVVVAWVQTNPDSGESDIYAQRYDANGLPQWGIGGIPLVATSEYEFNVAFVPDLEGGFLAVWREGNSLLVSQRFDANANAVWPARTELGIGYPNDVQPDGEGGALLSFSDGDRQYVQKVDRNGERQWGSGTQVSAFQNWGLSRIDSDRAGGLWFGSTEPDPLPSTYDVRVAHVNAAGVVVETHRIGDLDGPSDDREVRIAYAGSDGAHVAWTQIRAGDPEVKVHQVGSNTYYTMGGDPNSPQWTGDLEYDGENGTIFTWESEILGTKDIFAERMLGRGWSHSSNGMLVCDAPNNQFDPVVVRNGTSSFDFLILWEDRRNWPILNLFVQRLDGASGAWGHPEVKIEASSIYDCDGDDEGGCLGIEWARSQLDGPGFVHPADPVTRYAIWRAVDVLPMYPPDPIHGCIGKAECEGWKIVAEVDATGASSYFTTVPTTRDASPGDPALHYFTVVAYDSLGVAYLADPVSAASHDEIAPETPAEAEIMRTGATVSLSWLPSTAADFVEFRVDRRNMNLAGRSVPIATTTSPSFVDELTVPVVPYAYRVYAIDDNGNVSAPSPDLIADPSPTAVDSRIGSTALRMMAPTPNPFSGQTQFRVGLGQRSSLVLELFDVRGRRVRREVRAPLAEGWHDLTLDGVDDTRQALSSGVYFLRVLNDAGASQTRKLVVVR